MTSSGSKSRLKKTRGKHEAQDQAGEQGADQKELTSESYASLMSRSPKVVYPCPWHWGFFL
jgi:hypothetical protein